MAKRFLVNINDFRADGEGRNLKDKMFCRPKGLNSFTNNKNLVLIQARNIHTGEIEQEERGNLIVYHGRSWLMQRAFDLNLGAADWDNNLPSSPGVTRKRYNEMYLNWFALGTGGALPGGSILQAEPAKEVNYQLDSHDLSNGYIHPSLADHGILEYNNKQYHPFDSGFPKFYDDPHITGSGGQDQISDYSEMQNVSQTFTDPDTGSPASWRADSFLRALVRVTITPEECNGARYYNPSLISDPYYQDVNEAGLFVSPSHDRLDSRFTEDDMVQMFARVTFSTIRKDSSRELVFSWYVYF